MQLPDPRRPEASAPGGRNENRWGAWGGGGGWLGPGVGWRLGLLLMMMMMLVVVLGSGGCATSRDREDGSGREERVLTEEDARMARGSLAAVEIQGHGLLTVSETVQSVFTEAGFAVHSNQREVLTFDRPATRRLVAAYGNWFTMEMRLRLKVEMIPRNGGRYLLVCRSYVARDAGTMAEDEQPLSRGRAREYESLLDEVASRLN